jgi:hypothetical protein
MDKFEPRTEAILPKRKRKSADVITIRRNIVNAINVLKNHNDHVTLEMIRSYLNDYFNTDAYNHYILSNGIRFLLEMGAIEAEKVGKEKHYTVTNDSYDDPLMSRVLLYFPLRVHNMARDVAKATGKSISAVLAGWLISGSKL